MTDRELTLALRRCRRRIYALAVALVAVPVVLSVVLVAVR